MLETATEWYKLEHDWNMLKNTSIDISKEDIFHYKWRDFSLNKNVSIALQNV